MFVAILASKWTHWETLETNQGSVQFTVLQRKPQYIRRSATKASIKYPKAVSVWEIRSFKDF